MQYVYDLLVNKAGINPVWDDILKMQINTAHPLFGISLETEEKL